MFQNVIRRIAQAMTNKRAAQETFIIQNGCNCFDIRTKVWPDRGLVVYISGYLQRFVNGIRTARLLVNYNQ